MCNGIYVCCLYTNVSRGMNKIFSAAFTDISLWGIFVFSKNKYNYKSFKTAEVDL